MTEHERQCIRLKQWGGFKDQTETFEYQYCAIDMLDFAAEAEKRGKDTKFAITCQKYIVMGLKKALTMALTCVTLEEALNIIDNEIKDLDNGID